MNQQRGAALVLILWLVAMLAALVANFAILARVEMLQAGIGDRGGLARQHARAGVEYAVALLLTRSQTIADGRPYRWTFQGSEVELRLRDESGKVDLNLAPPALLAAFFEASGASAEQAAGVAGGIVQQRAIALGRFLEVGQLQAVPGVDSHLYARVREDLTVHAGVAIPVAAVASDPVRAALARHLEQSGLGAPAGAGAGLTYSVDSRVVSAAGGRAHVRGVVRLVQPADPGMTYSLLGWEEGDSVR